MTKKYLRIVTTLLLALVLTVSLAGAFPYWERMEDEGMYIHVEKEEYKEGETVYIALRNDGNLTYHPMEIYVKIFNMETDELVYDGAILNVTLPAVPSEEVMEWDQENMDGEQVPPGNYRVIFMERYTDNFTIHEERDTPLPFILSVMALTVAVTMVAIRKRSEG